MLAEPTPGGALPVGGPLAGGKGLGCCQQACWYIGEAEGKEEGGAAADIADLGSVDSCRGWLLFCME